MKIEKLSSSGGSVYSVDGETFLTLSEAEDYVEQTLESRATEQQIVTILFTCPSVQAFKLTGSQYYTGKPAKDLDFLVLTTNPNEFIKHGFYKKREYLNGSICYRRDNVDLVCLSTECNYLDWVSAAEVCKFLKLTNKDQVVKVHEIITGNKQGKPLTWQTTKNPT